MYPCAARGAEGTRMQACVRSHTRDRCLKVAPRTRLSRRSVPPTHTHSVPEPPLHPRVWTCVKLPAFRRIPVIPDSSVCPPSPKGPHPSPQGCWTVWRVGACQPATQGQRGALKHHTAENGAKCNVQSHIQ